MDNALLRTNQAVKGPIVTQLLIVNEAPQSCFTLEIKRLRTFVNDLDISRWVEMNHVLNVDSAYPMRNTRTRQDHNMQ